MDLPNNPSLEMFKQQSLVRMLYVVGGILLLVAVSVVLAKAEETNEAIRFIKILVFFMTALSITAAVFTGLHLGDKREAFGLPSGSIRALLAVGVVILFVVFGLPLVAVTPPSGADRPKPIATVSVPADKVGESAKLYTDQHFEVIVTKYGSGTNPATMEVRPPDYFAERLDISKQLVTAIVTLLTSVISFYFGSRSVTDALKSDTRDDNTVSDLSVRRKELSTRIDSLKDGLSSRAKKIEETSTLPDPKNATEAAARKSAADAAAARRKGMDERLASITALLAAVDQSIANVTATSSSVDARAVNQQSAKDNLVRLADSLTDTEAQLSAYDNEIKAYEMASAAG